MKLGRIGRSDTVEDADERQLRLIREERIAYARANKAWHEVPAGLVHRGPGGRYLVDADSDAVYCLRKGAVFEAGRARPGYVHPDAELYFTVDPEVGFVALDRPFGSRTWTEVFEKRLRAAAG